MIIANPIYDSVFKFLMEDERVAKVLLSALLKKEVREVTMRRNEYTNMQQSRISLFRIDFSAKIVDHDGQERLVLIELQKTWLATETLRFRQYLGTQYLNQDNIMEEGHDVENGKLKGYGLPMISIYILGHKIGDLQQAVVYIDRHYLDYDSQPIQQGVPDPFIESLTHDSIIVQIPYLQGNARNHLERLLRVFDQDYRLIDDIHLLNVEEQDLAGDERLLVNRLALAATSSGLRRDMQVEDEILSEIERRDTTILLKDKEIRKKEQVIEQKEQEIEQKSQMLHRAVQSLSSRGLSIGEIASVLSISEAEVSALFE